MPFLRFSRDKRGYEHFYLVQPLASRRGKPQQHRILYWYRSPPNVKVGREPFDEPVRRALEAQNPGVEFDWETIRATPFPPVQPEHWRDRRRAEKAAPLQAKDDGEREATAEATIDTPDDRASVVATASASAGAVAVTDRPDATDFPGRDVAGADVPRVPGPGATGPGVAAAGQRARRRRRRGRQGRGEVEGSPIGAVPAEPAPLSSIEADGPAGDSPPEDADKAPGD